jgi:quinol-cytochrome oxidoreductase complex cytochrome b subunit
MFGFEWVLIVGVVLFFFLPFLINSSLARSRGKSICLMLILTVIFSWIVTLVLACLPKAEQG